MSYETDNAERGFTSLPNALFFWPRKRHPNPGARGHGPCTHRRVSDPATRDVTLVSHSRGVAPEGRMGSGVADVTTRHEIDLVILVNGRASAERLGSCAHVERMRAQPKSEMRHHRRAMGANMLMRSPSSFSITYIRARRVLGHALRGLLALHRRFGGARITKQRGQR
jgi:hypothetical protein